MTLERVPELTTLNSGTKSIWLDMSSNNIRYPQHIGNWWLGEKLGSGFSGSIFRATNVHTGQTVALKLQDKDDECPTNKYERGFYPSLQGGIGMPTLWSAGIEGRWDYLAIDLLGSSLHSLYWKSGKHTMDLRSVCCIAMQVIARLEFMHSKGILHRDIQLGNCVVGLPPNETTIYMIDFGFSKRYIDPITRRHIPDSKAKRDFIGNYWFSSVNVHCRGTVPSRRDDLEALALMLIHLLTPNGLTWTRNGVPKNSEQHERLKHTKRMARPEELCRYMPNEFEEFLRYCRKLKFEECPEYQYWVEMFRDLAVERGFPESEAFIWPPPPTPLKKTILVNTSRVNHVQAKANDRVVQVLDALANMRLEDNEQVLGDRTQVANAVREARGKSNEPSGQSNPPKTKNVIVISRDGEEEGSLQKLPKGRRLSRLTGKMPRATDNQSLSKLVLEFVNVLEETCSRSLTIEGFAFLDALYKQLADPSVFVQPMRTSKKSGKENAEKENPGGDALARRRAKLGKLLSLKGEAIQARDNRTLARLVKDFGAEIDKGKSKTLTKNAMEFLHVLGGRLREIR